MRSELLDLAGTVVQSARKRGAQHARASAHRIRESILEWRNGKLDRLRESTQMGISVHLFVDGRYSASSTSDLRREALDRFLEEAVAATRVLKADPHRKLADPARYQGRFAGDLAIHDPGGSAEMTPAERKRVAAALEAGARAEKGAERILTVMAECTDELGETAMVTSNGMEGERQSTAFSLFGMTSVKDQGDRKPTGTWYAASRRRQDLAPPEEVGRQATRRALACLGEKPEKSGRYPCIIENAVVGRLLGGLLEPLKGGNIQQRRSFLADKLGQRIAATSLTLVDDPLLPGGMASRTYDGEGMTTVKRPIIEAGILRTHFLDTYYASKLGREPTTGGSTNLVFPVGKRDLAGLLQAMGRGILITGFSGGNANPATGDFSIGIRGQWIEGGKPVRPLAEMNLAGNHLELWQGLRELGSDPFTSSEIVSPSLRFAAVQCSGT